MRWFVVGTPSLTMQVALGLLMLRLLVKKLTVDDISENKTKHEGLDTFQPPLVLPAGLLEELDGRIEEMMKRLDEEDNGEPLDWF